jgi:hypothetical protein
VILDAVGLPEPLRLPVTYTVVPAKARVSPSNLAFDTILYGHKATRRIEIATSLPNTRIRGTAEILPPTPGVQVTPEFIGESAKIDVTVDAGELESGRDFVRRVRLNTTAGVFEVPLRARTAIRTSTVWIHAGIIAIGAAMIGLFIRLAIAASLADSNHWFIVVDSTGQYETLFRVVGTPAFCAGAGYVFRCFARWQWPLYFEQLDNRRKYRRDMQRQAMRGRGATAPPIQPAEWNPMHEPAIPLPAMAFFAISVLMIACWTLLPGIGEFTLFVFDRIAFGVRWFGASSPTEAWCLTGAVLGALIGAAVGVRRAGAPRHVPKLGMYAVGIVVGLFLLGVVYSAAMRPTPGHGAIGMRQMNDNIFTVRTWN